MKLERSLADGRVLAVGLGLALGIVMLAVFPAFALLGIAPAVQTQLWPYWAAMGASLTPYALIGLYRGLFNALDRPWASVWIAFAGVALNVPLNWVLIHGVCELEGLGLAGAGVASLLANTVSLLLFAAVWRWAAVRPRRRGAPRPSMARTISMLREGWPAALSNLGEGGSYAAAGLMMTNFGSVALAANQVVHSVAALMYMLPMGMTAAVSIRVGQAMGAGQATRVRAVGVAASLVITAWIGAFATLLLVFRRDFAAVLAADPLVVQLAGAMFLALAFTQFADGLQATAQGALRGLLDIQVPTAITIGGCWFLALPLAYGAAAKLGLGPVGIWIGYGLGVLVTAVALQVRLAVLAR